MLLRNSWLAFSSIAMRDSSSSCMVILLFFKCLITFWKFSEVFGSFRDFPFIYAWKASGVSFGRARGRELETSGNCSPKQVMGDDQVSVNLKLSSVKRLVLPLKIAWKGGGFT
jgi:hypothetical protein